MKELDIIKQSIAEGKTKNSISQFRDFIESKSFDKRIETRAYYDKVILVSGRLGAIENEMKLGIIRKEDELVERNKINNDLLKLINEFPKVSDATHIPVGESITQRVKNISTQNKFKYDIFLSFSSRDKEAAIKLYESLIGYGLRVFISSEYFKKNVGASFQSEIEYALKHSRSFLLFWTENAKQSKWVEIEYKAFFQEFYMREGKERKFYIFWPKDNSYVALPLFLRQLQFTSSSRELVFSILQEEEARIKAVQEVKQKESEVITDTVKEKQQKEEAAVRKAEKEKQQKDDEARAKAEKEKQQKEEAAKANAENEKRRQEKGASAKAEQEKKRREDAAREKEKEQKEDEANRKADWEKAKKLNTINSYEKFLAKYKNGRFVSSAKKNLTLEKNAKKRRDTITKKAYQSQTTTKSDSSSNGTNRIVNIFLFLLSAAFTSFIFILIILFGIYLIETVFTYTIKWSSWGKFIVIGSVIAGLIYTFINYEEI